MYSKLILSLVIIGLVKGSVDLSVTNDALDQNLYEEVLDSEQCLEQLDIIRNNSLLAMSFADAGMRIPRGILEGNTLDMGNYHQCIGINQPIASSGTELQGKYCMIRVPLDQSFDFPWELPDFNFNSLRLDAATVKTLEEFRAVRTGMNAMSGVVADRGIADNPALAAITFRLALCIPKPCTTEQAINSLITINEFNISSVGFQYTEDFCRLPDDKPWVAGDTVAVVIFSLIGLLTVVSTTFDVWQTIILKKDPKTVSLFGKLFSVYTNGRRVMKFQSDPNRIECLDGIRPLAIMWVVLGHTFSTVQNWSNPIDGFLWMTSWQSLWVAAAPISMDTLLMLNGFLVVYTTVGKFNQKQLVRNVHWFWLNRLLRLFPLLATAVLLEATLLNRVTDGPMWSPVETRVQNCRTYWWSTLLHIHNYVNPLKMCVGQTWYLAIYVQLYIQSPLMLYSVLHRDKKRVWGSLLSSVIIITTLATVYNFFMKFPSSVISPSSDPTTILHYMDKYYMNMLTRGAPFFVGGLFGYIVKTQKLVMSKITTACYWIAAFSLSTFLIYTNHPIVQPDWDNQVADSLYNSFMRPLWALFVGSLVFACVNGYGGPINWFLSLKVWKLQSRMSYGIYLFHYGLMIAVNSSAIAPVFFSVKSLTFLFLAHYTLAFIVTFVLVLLIDAPCSTLVKLFIGGPKKQLKREEEVVLNNDVERSIL